MWTTLGNLFNRRTNRKAGTKTGWKSRYAPSAERNTRVRPEVHALEQRLVMTAATFGPGSLIIDMGQSTQTVGNALKPYGLVYDLVTNFRVPVEWAIDPNKSTFRLDAGNPIPYDFTATTTNGVKSYAGGSFIVDENLLTPAVIAQINTWKTQGVVVDELADPLTTEIYGEITSFPKAVLDLQNGRIATPYYANAGIPASSYRLGDPSSLNECDDVYIMPHADPHTWVDAWKQNLYTFVNNGGGLWVGCHAVSALESLTTFTNNGTTQKLNFLSNNLVPWGSHSAGVVPYDYNTATANDPIMQIMNRMDAALQSGSEKIYVPTGVEWRTTTNIAVYDADQPNNPSGGSSPYNKAAALAYGHAYGDPKAGLVMYEGGHTFAGTAPANVAAQRAFFNWLLQNGINKAPRITATPPKVVPGQSSTITASIAGGSGTFSYQWVSANGGTFSNPAGTWKVGDPAITTQYQMNGLEDTIKLLVSDQPCGRQSLWYQNLSITPPTLDLDGNDSTGATGADYLGYFDGNGTIVPAADVDTAITAGGTTIQSAVIQLKNRPDGAAETLLIDEAIAASLGISVTSDGEGGYQLSGTATLAQYQTLIASLQYVNGLAYPTPDDRQIEVTVNDGTFDSNTAVSVLAYAGGSPSTVDKQLYLSDPGSGMDRVNPVATNDTTTARVSISPVQTSDSTGMAVYTNSSTKDLVYNPWNLTAYGTAAKAAVDGGSYNTMATAASRLRNEAIVVGVTTDRFVAGSVWNGTAWTPIKIKVAGKVVSKLGAPSQQQWWGASVAYETGTGNAVLVWNTGKALNYSVWNGKTWSDAAAVAGYTGTEPRQIRLAANPTAGSNEMVLVVTDKNEVDRAMVWNGTTWGNMVQLDSNTGHNYTDLAVAYESLTGKAMVTYASGTAGVVGYRVWDGTAWGTAATLTAASGTDKYAQWTVMASDPASNRIVLGVETNGQDAWMSVWDGSAWTSTALGVANNVNNNGNLNIAVAFESKSGEALAVYQNDLSATELQYRTWSQAAGWSAGTDFGAFNSKSSVGIGLTANPYSDQIMLVANDGAKILRSNLWGGSAFAASFTQLESNTNSTTGQPFGFFWDNNLPGVVTEVETFTQTAPMVTRLALPSGGAVKVTTYIEVTSGTLPANPQMAVRVGYGGSPVTTLQSAPTVTALGSNRYKLEWSSTLGNNVTIPAGAQLAFSLAVYEVGYGFDILFDSKDYPSQVQLATSTAIKIETEGVFAGAFPNQTAVQTAVAGEPSYVRFTVSDPFGAYDINGADLVIKDSAGATVATVALDDASVVKSADGTKTYEYKFTPMKADTFSMVITAKEGTEGVTATARITLPVTAYPDLVVSKTDNGATVKPGASVPYTISYSNAGLSEATGVVLTETLPDGVTFDAAGSTAGWVPLGAGQYIFPVGTLAPGASGQATFAVKVGATVPAALEKLLNTVKIEDDGSHGPDANPGNNQGEDTTPVDAAPDLVIVKTDNVTATVAGGVVLYKIAYSNVGKQDAIGVVITERLPDNTSFNENYSFGHWDTEGGVYYTYPVGDLPAGASGFVTFAVTLDATLPAGFTGISNTVIIEDSGNGGPDPDPSNNTSTDTTPLSNDPRADLRVTKTDGKSVVHPGELVTYTITVTNAGPTAVTGAIFNDEIPAALRYVTYTAVVAGGATASSLSGIGNTITGTLDLPVGGTVTYTVKGTLDVDATGHLTNAATVVPPAGIVDPNSGDNTGIDEDEIVPVSDLSLDKSYTYTDLDGSRSLTAGDEIVFTVLVTNNGPDAARNVSVMDRLPTGYQYVSDDSLANGYDYSPGSGLWTIGTIGSRAGLNTAKLMVKAIVSAGGDYTNKAEVWGSDSSDPDSTPHNYVPTEDDYDSVTPPVKQVADLSIDKRMALKDDLDSNGILSAGDRVTFTLLLKNAGPNAAANVKVFDSLPEGFTFVSATPSVGTYSSATGEWTVGTVNALTSQTLTIVATVVGGKPATSYDNTARVTSDTFDINPDNNTDTTVPPVADLSLTKTVAFADGGDLDGDDTPSTGDILVFTVTVSNAGPDFATGVEVADQLPTGFTYDSDDSNGAYSDATGLWAVGAIAPGTKRTLSIVVVVNGSGNFTNTAQVSKTRQFDPDSKPGNNAAGEDDQASAVVVPGASAKAPVAVNDQSLGNKPGPVTLNITNNDTDQNLDIDPSTVDLDPSTAGIQNTKTVAGEGTWTVDADGNATFTPVAGFTNDPTPIPYTVSDSGGRVSNQATITIDFVPVPADDNSSNNTPGTPVTVNVVANDTNGDTVVPGSVEIVGTNRPGDPLVVQGEGTWTVNPTTGAITFTPQAGFTGDPTPIRYTVKDNDGNTSVPAKVTIDYKQQPPVAADDSSLKNQPGPVTLNVTNNDTDSDGDLDPGTVDLDPSTPGRQTIYVVPNQGLWQVDDAGNVTFSPLPGFTTDPTPITYTVNDTGGLLSNVAKITVGYVPVAAYDSSKGNTVGTPVTLKVLTNDTAGDTPVASTLKIMGTSNPGDPLVVPGEGTWSVNPSNGDITFTPLAGFTGNPTPIRYTVNDAQGNPSLPATVVVDYTPQPPVAVNDESRANKAGPVSLSVTGNDSDPSNTLNPASVDLDPTVPGRQTTLAVPGQGVWTVDNTGKVTFTPAAGFTKDPSPIPYTVANTGGQVSNQATITIDYVPVATDDSSTGNPLGQPVTLDVLANDTLGDTAVPSTLKIVGTNNPGDPLVVPGEGTWSVNPTNGAITFTPLPGFTGNPTPINYTVKDNDGNESAPAKVTVVYQSPAPVAVNDESRANQPGPVSLVVTGNDTDGSNSLDVASVDLDPTSPGRQTSLTVTGQGVWTVDNSGKVTFTPAPGFTQDPTPIPYTVSNTAGKVSNVATITIDYLPVATDDSSANNPTGSPVTLNVLANDTLGDTVVPSTLKIVGTNNPGDPLVVPGEGTWTVNPTTGAITFTPQAGFTGDPTPIRYTVKDNDGNESAPAKVTVDYLQIPPVAANDESRANPAGPVSLGILGNDTDANGDLDPATVDLDPASPGRQTSLTVTGQGVWSVDNSGKVTFTPAPGFTKDPSPITYTVSDKTGLVSNVATITIDYVPVAADDSSTGNQPGRPVSIRVVGNDTTGDEVDPATIQIAGTANPGDPLVVPGEGTWSINPVTGTITFTPEPGFLIDPTPIRYTVKDGEGNVSNPAQVTVKYNKAPDLSITKDNGVTSIRPGQMVTYTLGYANKGTADSTGVVITDTIPAGMTFNQASNPGWVLSSGVLSYPIGTVVAGASGQVQLKLVANATFPAGVGRIANTASIGDDGANGADPTPGDNTAVDNDELIAAPDLLVTKDNGVTKVKAGDSVTYTLAYRNKGSQGATGVVITDNLPVGLAFDAMLNPGWSLTGTVLSYSLGLVPAGASGSIQLRLTAATSFAAGQASVVNTALIADDGSNGPDENPADNTGTDTDELVAAPNLSIRKDDGVKAVAANQVVIYTLSYANRGTQGATGVVITDTVPANLNFDATQNPGWSLSGSTLAYTLGAVPAGASGSVTLKFTASPTFPAGQSRITNTVTIADDGTNGPDEDPLDNSDTDVNDLDAARDLWISKDNGVKTVVANQAVTYTIRYANGGTKGATGVVITDTIPAGMTFVAADNTGWTRVGDTLTYLVGSVAGGARGSVSLKLVAKASFPSGQRTIANTATVTDDGFNGPDLNPDDNTSTDTDELIAAPDLAVVKDSSVTEVRAGQSVTYTLAYTNKGTQDANGVTLSDSLPLGMGFNAAANPGWTLNGTTLSYTVGNVAVGASGTVSLVLVADATFAAGQASVINTVAIADDGSNGPDLNPTDNSDRELDNLIASPDLRVTKNDGRASVRANDLVTYTLGYANNGTQGATGVTITDSLPAGTSFNAAANPGWTLNGSTLTYALGTVPAGSSGSIQLSLRVNASFPAGQASIANTALIADDGTNGPDLNPADNSGADINALDAAPDMAVLKTDGNASVKPGEQVTYLLRYRNKGTQDATGVVISDTVVAGLNFSAAANPGWTQNGSTLTYTVGNVAVGGSGLVKLVLSVDAAFPAGRENIRNTAVIADDGTNGADPDPTDNSSSDTNELDAAPDLRVTKSNGLSVVHPGENVTYTIAYANSGNQGATGVVISDLLPAGNQFSAADNNGWTLANGTLSYTVGNLPAGASGSVSLVLAVSRSFAAGQMTIANTAVVGDDGSNGPDLNPADNSGQDSDPIALPVGGKVFYDRNTDGLLTGEEDGIYGVVVNLVDSQGNVVATTTTGADGTYLFPSVLPGNYTVREDQPQGYGSSTPNSVPLSVDVNTTPAPIHFGETLATLSGQVWLDLNKDGKRQQNDIAIPGVTITLERLDVMYVQAFSNPFVTFGPTGGSRFFTVGSTVTDANGQYEFLDLFPGEYRVVQSQPSGYLQGQTLPGSVGGAVPNLDEIESVNLDAGQAAVAYDYTEVAKFAAPTVPGVTPPPLKPFEISKRSYLASTPDMSWVLNAPLQPDFAAFAPNSGVNPTAFVVTGSGVGSGVVRVFDFGQDMERFRIQPYGENVGVRVAKGDVTGDGVQDFVTAPAGGVSPEVKIYDGNTGNLIRSFMAYDPAFKGGLWLATGDLNNDGVQEIVTGTDAGAIPHVVAFNAANGTALHSFYAYDVGFRGGVRVAVGDLDGNGFGEIITAAGAGASPHVVYFNGMTAAVEASFYAYAPGYLGGVQIATGDTNGDGVDEVIAASGVNAAGGAVYVFNKAGTTIAAKAVSDAVFGLEVGSQDIDMDGKAEIILGRNTGSNSKVDLLDGVTLNVLDSFYADDPRFTGGISVA